MAQRMLAYHGLLHEAYDLPVISMIIYPFETNTVESPYIERSCLGTLVTFQHRPLALWTLEAQKYIDEHAISMYPLLPTMRGANLPLLLQSIMEMKENYSGEDFAHRLLWFRTLLGRVKSISDKDKSIIGEEIFMFDELLDDDPYLLDRDARVARREAQEAKLRTLRETILDLMQFNFPGLTEFAQAKVTRITKPETLRMLIVQISKAADENAVRTLLNLAAV